MIVWKTEVLERMILRFSGLERLMGDEKGITVIPVMYKVRVIP